MFSCGCGIFFGGGGFVLIVDVKVNICNDSFLGSYREG